MKKTTGQCGAFIGQCWKNGNLLKQSWNHTCRIAMVSVVILLYCPIMYIFRKSLMFVYPDLIFFKPLNYNILWKALKRRIK